MGDVIFARPRTDYGSYVDLYRLIELAGYPLIFADEIERDSDNAYIVTVLNGETQNGWDGARARIVLWDLEYHLDGIPPIPGVSEVWASDKWYAGCIGARYVLIGSDERLVDGAPADGSIDYDVAFLAYMVGRRQRIAGELHAQGVHLSPSSAWEAERHRVLSRSRVYLCVHQHDHVPTIAPLRMVVAAAYRLPVISEAVADRGAFETGDLMTSDYSHLADFVRMWTKGENNHHRLADYGYALHSKLCEQLNFRTCVEAAL